MTELKNKIKYYYSLYLEKVNKSLREKESIETNY